MRFGSTRALSPLGALFISGTLFIQLNAAQDPEMMAAMEAAMTPGEFHQKLSPMIGAFEVASRMWMAPNQEPLEESGSNVGRWVLGERFVEQRFEGSFMGMPFSGIGYVGYDNIQKKYVTTWIDSMGTGIMTGEGLLKDDGSFEFKVQYPDVMTGKMLVMREIVRIQDHDHHLMEMFMTGPDGKEFKNLEIRYTRKK